MNKKSLFLLVMTFISTQSSAADSSPDLSVCMPIEDPLQRVACFDELARVYENRSRQETGPEIAPAQQDQTMAPETADPEYSTPIPVEEAIAVPALTEDSATVIPALDSDEVSDFGQEPATQARVESNEDGEKELIDTVASLRQTEPNKWLITLDSGQVWKQTIGRQFLLKENDQVRIYPTGWGSAYRLSVVGKSSFIQVERLR